MKILVNSKYIASAFRVAIKDQSDEVSLSGSELTFLGGENNHSYNVHVMSRSDSVYLNKVTLYRAYRFVKALEEQPIVVEITFDQIEFSRFVKRFVDNNL